MKKITESIKEQVIINFTNLETAIRTYDRNALVCGSPAWRYVYHTIHSADKWFINPSDYTEPKFHENGSNNPDNPTEANFSDEFLLKYMRSVLLKIMKYLDTLDDDMLYEKPDGCEYTRMELVLGQFRHFCTHTGMLNGMTTQRTGKFPVFLGLDKSRADKLKYTLYD